MVEPSQRVRGGGIRIRSDRRMDRRGRMERGNLSKLRRVGIRQLPGVCWYSVKCTAVMAVNQGGTADSETITIRP